MTVADFIHSAEGRSARWRFRGQLVEKCYGGPISATVLADGSGVLIIEPGADRSDNALIFDGDGSERRRISNPFASRGAICFTEAGYHRGELTLVSRLKGLEIACVIDERGSHIRQYEIR